MGVEPLAELAILAGVDLRAAIEVKVRLSTEVEADSALRCSGDGE